MGRWALGAIQICHSDVKKGSMGVYNQFGGDSAKRVVDARRHPRYKLEVDISVYPRNDEVVRGYTVDISESGISAMLRVEVPIGEVVRLEFSLPEGDVEAHATVRQRNAFRFGFQFVDCGSKHELITRTCRQLALEQATEPTNSYRDI